MKQLLDFFPLIVFFGFYQFGKDIVLATGALMVATVVQVGFMWLRYRRVERIHLITLGAVMVFGGLTVALDNDLFIKWKPTIVNWLLALILFFSPLVARRNLIQKMLEHQITAPVPVWRNLNLAWATFFALSGALNLYVAFSFSQETWVNFKVFGLLGLTLAFSVFTILYLSRHLKEQPDQSE
ncbi:septation protein A [Marinobacteraceae bacterium S3BR75-40.1]